MAVAVLLSTLQNEKIHGDRHYRDRDFRIRLNMPTVCSNMAGFKDHASNRKDHPTTTGKYYG
jgi:hypothetical protein